MRSGNEATITANEESCTEQLARFFSAVQPVRITANVSAQRAGSKPLQESVLVEYCGPEHAIFLSALPLEYNDEVRLAHEKSADQLDARVIAVQYHEGLKAVAVQFQNGPCHWVTKT